ncbi:putative START-like domain superfamily protein [Plasmopara halstedii]
MNQKSLVYPHTPLNVSAADALSYENLADQLVAETLRTHDEYVAQGRLVDQSRWKAVKEKHNMTAYRIRERVSRFRRNRFPSDETEAVATSPRLPSFYHITDQETNEALVESYPSVTITEAGSDDEIQDEWKYGDEVEHDVVDKSRPARVPMVFCTGIVPGTIEDAALAFFADTENRSRMRNVSSKEASVDDMRILARFQGPSEDDPFRFLGIKWCLHAPRGIIKPRDYVILESTGMALDSDGKRFAYVLNHSVEGENVPDFRAFGIVRILFSACHIMRPHDAEGSIEVFSRGFMDTRGYIAERLSTYIFCDRLMTVPQTIAEAYTKKLVWLLTTQRRADTTLRLAPLDVNKTCPCCLQKLTKGFAKLLDGTCMCQLCRKTICRKCTVKKAIPIVTDRSGHLTQKTMDFCLSCFLKATSLPAWQVAMSITLMSSEEDLILQIP